MENKKNTSLEELITSFSEQNKSPNEIIVALLFKARTDIHLTHIAQSDKTLATHQALAMFYEDVLDKIDTFLETSIGINDSVNVPDVPGSSTIEEPLDYFKGLYNSIQTLRADIQESFLQNQIDEMQQLIAHTMYRLKKITS